MIIAITGTPGTGKTTLAKKIAKLGFKYIDGKKIGKTIAESYDKEMETYIVDEKKFAREMARILPGLPTKKKEADYEKLIKFLPGLEISEKAKKSPDAVIDSHLSHYVSKRYVDYVVVARCDISVLKSRLLKRRYPSEKIKENIEAEIFDVCGIEAKEMGHMIIYLDRSS